MDIEIRELTPDLAEDYARFFDVTPHDLHVDEHRCYCVCWSSDDYEGKDFSTAEKRRAAALRYVEDGTIQGYLAYCDSKIVGWCNANAKMDCLKCASWRRFMDYVPLEDASSGARVKSIFCYVVAPEMMRKGIATRLMQRVIEDAARDGFDFVEAYPGREPSVRSSNFGGYLEMYKGAGFQVSVEAEQGIVVRKSL